MRFRKVIFAFMIMTLILPATVDAAGLPDNVTGEMLEKYNFRLYMLPVWESGTIFQESVVFYIDGNGDVRGGELLYTPEEIISVRNFGLDTEFAENADYIMTGKGIALTENSRIPVMPRSAYCDESDKTYTHQLKDGDGGAIKTDNGVLSKYYLSVSYRTSAKWEGVVPQNQLDRLPNLRSKLENKEPVTVAILGDSISVGYSTSGLNDPTYRVTGEQITARINIPPYMPVWPKLVGEALGSAFEYDGITVVNCAVGGTNTSSDCLPDMIERVVQSDPDLVIIGFGMNEFWSPPAGHVQRLTRIIEQISASVPNAEYVLVSSMEPNLLAYDEKNIHLSEFEEEYFTLRDKSLDMHHIAVAPVNSVYMYARETKGDFGLIGGNQNHPNDFAARLYAQTVAAVLGIYDLMPDDFYVDPPPKSDETGTRAAEAQTDEGTAEQNVEAGKNEKSRIIKALAGSVAALLAVSAGCAVALIVSNKKRRNK